LAAEFEKQRQDQNEALAQRENKLKELKTQLDEREKSVEQLVASRLETERKQLSTKAAQDAEGKVSAELKSLRGQLEEQQSELKKAKDGELDLLRKKREVEEAREKLDLELARQLDVERKKIADTVREQTQEAERLKLADKEEVIKGLQTQIEALRKRAEQGSMQLQGEALEVTVENDLRQLFLYDEIAEIKKGERGADVLQRVRTNIGMDCGAILWEAKRAKNWAGVWLEKLKEDQREAKAELAVLVTTCPPQGVRGIGLLDGVWVCEPAFACAIASALRQGLINTALQRTRETGRADKMAQLYDYMCGVEFRQHVEGVVESFVLLKEQLGAEQRAFARQWKEREQQLNKAIQHTAMLYGSVQGIAGRAALPEIHHLQIPGADAMALPILQPRLIGSEASA